MNNEHDQPTLPAGEGPGQRSESHDLPPIQQIGPYRLLRRIGEGGMGEVYLAQQQEPIRRQVALKLIKAGMDTKQVMARFDAERQALALMDHPCIAKVLDAGATEQGRPYFVMEYVPGVPITQYCDLHKLSIRERLVLFMRVCEGVQHAHQKALIHRDLKPSNILVYEQDGAPVPKIIDFGVAKATAQRLTEQTVFTELGQMIGTPEYMSPEQADIGVDNVDTRTDIYSLGVILYELLVGVLPFDSKDLRRAGFLEIQRKIREDEPSRPSARLSALQQTPEHAARRSVEPVRLLGLIRGDLDWITMKAMEKDRNRRYETANGFAMDIQRYLDNEPVLATPPSTGYRLRKFARRNRGGVAAAGTILVVLVGAAILSTTLYLRAGREAARARTQAARSDQVAAFMKNMLAGVGPLVAQGRDTKLLRGILDDTAKRLGTQLGDQPEVRAEMLSVLGQTYLDLGENQTAATHLNEALALRRKANGERHPKALEASYFLGVLQYQLGQFEKADSLLGWTADAQAAVLGPQDPATLTTLASRVGVFSYEGRLDEAVALGEKILDPLKKMGTQSSATTESLMYAMAQAYTDQQKFTRAESLYVDLLHQHGKDDPRTMMTKVSYGWLLRTESRLPEAEKMTKEALQQMRHTLGNDHSETQIAVNNLGIILSEQGKFAESEPYYLESVDVGKRTLGEKHPETVISMVNLGRFYLKTGRYADAEAILTRSIDIFRETMPPDHIGTGIAYGARGDCREKMGRQAAALPDYLAAYGILSKQHDSNQPRLRKLVENIAASYEHRGEASHAAEWRAKLAAAP